MRQPRSFRSRATTPTNVVDQINCLVQVADGQAVALCAAERLGEPLHPGRPHLGKIERLLQATASTSRHGEIGSEDRRRPCLVSRRNNREPKGMASPMHPAADLLAPPRSREPRKVSVQSGSDGTKSREESHRVRRQASAVGRMDTQDRPSRPMTADSSERNSKPASTRPTRSSSSHDRVVPGA